MSPPVQVPTDRAEVPPLAALPAQFRQADLAMLGNLHRRMGDAAPVACGASRRLAWARLVYANLGIEQPGIARARTDGSVSGLQAGTDLLVKDAWRAGVYVGYLDGKADVSGNARGITANVGRNDLRSPFLGAYVTWMGASGWYDKLPVERADDSKQVSRAAGIHSTVLDEDLALAADLFGQSIAPSSIDRVGSPGIQGWRGCAKLAKIAPRRNAECAVARG